MAIFKTSNHNPNLSEIDLAQKNEFNCQVNTSGENVRAYKLQILSSRGDEIICDGKKRIIDGVTYENAGVDCTPVKNKGFLKIPNISNESSESIDIISGKALENGKDYQWGIRTYGAPIGSKEQPRTMVCEGYIVGSTQYVIWVNMDGATEKDKKVANDNLQYNRYIEFKIPKDSITDSILPFSENYNNSNNLKYPPEPNTSDPNATTDTSEGNGENAEPSSQAEEGDANTGGEGTGSADTENTEENTEEKKDEKTLYVKRKKINWVEKELGEFKNITKIECEDSFEYNYKDGVSFDIYLCSDQHTPNSVFIDPNDQIELSNFIVIYENKKDYDAAIKAGETPATTNPTITPRNKATKIYGYSSDTGEVRVRDPFDPVPVNGNYYRIFEYDIVNKTYKEKTGGTSGKKQIVGGSPIQNALFKVYSNKWTGINGNEENRLFIQPNVNIKTDPTNPNEIVFEDKTRVDINQILDKTTYPDKTIDITFDKLDNTQWLLKGKAFSVVQNSGSIISLDTESYPLPKTNYTVYTDFMDSAPYSVFYARKAPSLRIGYTNLNKKSDLLGEEHITNGYISYRDIYFRTPWEYSDLTTPQQDVKYYHYKLYDEDGSLVAESQDIYSTELFEDKYVAELFGDSGKSNYRYVNTLDWGFKGLESGPDKDHPKCYKVELIVTDEYEKEFKAEENLKVYYNSFKDYFPLDVKANCKEQAIQISTKVPHCADTTDYTDEEGNVKKTVNEGNVNGNYLNITSVENIETGERIDYVLNYTETKTINGGTEPIVIPENISLLTKIQVTSGFVKEIEDGTDKEILRFGNKRYIDKENNKYVIDEYSLRLGNFNGFYKINEGTDNEQYVKNEKQLKFSWYKNNGENTEEDWQSIYCFNNGKNNYKDIRDIDFKNFKFQGITTLKYSLQEKDNIKMISIAPDVFINFVNNQYDKYKKENFVNQLLTQVGIEQTSRILLQDVYDDRGNKISADYFYSGVYIYNNNEEYNKWQHDLTVAYIYADDMNYFSSNTAVTMETLEVPSNCIDENNPTKGLKWPEEDEEKNNVWVDNDYEEEIEKINEKLFETTWFVIYFVSDKNKYKCEIRLQQG